MIKRSPPPATQSLAERHFPAVECESCVGIARLCSRSFCRVGRSPERYEMRQPSSASSRNRNTVARNGGLPSSCSSTRPRIERRWRLHRSEFNARWSAVPIGYTTRPGTDRTSPAARAGETRPAGLVNCDHRYRRIRLAADRMSAPGGRWPFSAPGLDARRPAAAARRIAPS